MTGTWRAAALFAALTLVLAFPLSIRPDRTVLADDPDSHLFMWTLAWNTHAFAAQPLSLFDANIFHPLRRTLAYSENLIGSALLTAPVLWLTANPVLAMNVVSLLACALCGLGAYVLGRRVGLSGPAAILCGVIFAFSPPRFFRSSQIHLATVQWIPFSLASLHAYLDGGRRRDLHLAIAFFSMQALATGHGAIFLATAIAIVLLYRVSLGEPIAPARRLRDVGAPGALLLLPAVLIYAPYRIVHDEMGFRRGFEAAETTLSSFLASPTPAHMALQSLVTDDVNFGAHAYLFPGWIPLLLAIVAVAPRLRLSRRRAPMSARAWRFLAVAIDGAAIACAAVAIQVMRSGPIRFRLTDDLLLRSSSPLRAWMLCAVLLLARIALARRVPFDISGRMARMRQSWQRWSADRRSDPAILYSLVVIVSVLIALGTTYGIWRYVYAIPGFGFIRVPSRFMVLGVLGIAVLAGLGFDRISASQSPRVRRALCAVAGILLVLEFAAIPLKVAPFDPGVPAADRWLNGQPKPFAVAEVPVTLSIRLHTTYMLHSTAHWQKTVHGYSGWRPPLHEDLYGRLRTFPDETSLDYLEKLAVGYVVVHPGLYEAGQWPDVEARLPSFSDRLTLEYADGDDRIYSLTSVTARGARPESEAARRE